MLVLDIKDKTFESLTNYYSKVQDMDLFISVCKEMVKAKNSTPQMRGEVCESVLYVMLKTFIEKNNLTDWRISKGLILKNVDDYNSSYFTELDITLFTPECVIGFECKSYKGEKYLSDKGTLYLVKKGKSKKVMDVFDQHYKHFMALENNIRCALQPVMHSKYKSYRLVYFDFGDVPTEDRREPNCRALFPIANTDNLFNLFRGYSERPKYWDMKVVNRVVDIIEKASKKNASAHLDYVASLNRGRSSNK